MALMFISRGFQHTYTSKTATKALGHDLDLYSVYMGQHAHFLCARDRVQPSLMIYYLEREWPQKNFPEYFKYITDVWKLHVHVQV